MHVSFYPYRRQQIYKKHAQYLQRKSPSFFTAHYATLNMHIKVLLQGYFPYAAPDFGAAFLFVQPFTPA